MPVLYFLHVSHWGNAQLAFGIYKNIILNVEKYCILLLFQINIDTKVEYFDKINNDVDAVNGDLN